MVPVSSTSSSLLDEDDVDVSNLILLLTSGAPDGIGGLIGSGGSCRALVCGGGEGRSRLSS